MTRTLLMIDDDEISREVMPLLMAPLGVVVLTAPNGEAALRLLDGGGVRPDGILLDAQLPGLSGVALAVALHRVCAAPILAFSASDIPSELAAATAGFLRKPSEPEAILGAFAAVWSPSARDIDGIGTPMEPTNASTNPVIDSAVLAKLRMPAATVRSMYAALAEDCTRRLTLLEAAMRAGDDATVRAEAHAIKGGAAMLGAQALRYAADKLEQETHSSEWPSEFAVLRQAQEALQALLEDASFDFAAPSV